MQDFTAANGEREGGRPLVGREMSRVRGGGFSLPLSVGSCTVQDRTHRAHHDEAEEWRDPLAVRCGRSADWQRSRQPRPAARGRPRSAGHPRHFDFHPTCRVLHRARLLPSRSYLHGARPPLLLRRRNSGMAPSVGDPSWTIRGSAVWSSRRPPGGPSPHWPRLRRTPAPGPPNPPPRSLSACSPLARGVLHGAKPVPFRLRLNGARPRTVARWSDGAAVGRRDPPSARWRCGRFVDRRPSASADCLPVAPGTKTTGSQAASSDGPPPAILMSIRYVRSCTVQDLAAFDGSSTRRTDLPVPHPNWLAAHRGPSAGRK